VAAENNARLKQLGCLQVGKLVIKRMKKTLSPQDFSRLVFLPPLSDDDYLYMYGAVDVVLDSFPFGGHTSSMDAFSAGGNPVVTLPTKLMSGRCTQGFYKHMGIQDLVANDLDEYVGIALRLGQDEAYREETRRKIRERLPSLVRDTTSARAWGDMLVTLVRGSEAQKKQLQWDQGARMVVSEGESEHRASDADD
jgi:predicted O-linked N-acetylglucosamine transferase (SPINDLY family)